MKMISTNVENMYVLWHHLWGFPFKSIGLIFIIWISSNNRVNVPLFANNINTMVLEYDNQLHGFKTPFG